MRKYQLDDMNNRLTILNRDIYNKRNEIAYLKNQIQVLEGCVNGLKNRNQEQQEGIQNKSYIWMECVFICMAGYHTIHNNYSYAKTSWSKIYTIWKAIKLSKFIWSNKAYLLINDNKKKIHSMCVLFEFLSRVKAFSTCFTTEGCIYVRAWFIRFFTCIFVVTHVLIIMNYILFNSIQSWIYSQINKPSNQPRKEL
jgi:hypothetical protein